MEVTLNIEAGQLGDTVVEMFSSLSEEQRQELCLKIMREWLSDPKDYEAIAKRNEAIRKIREKVDSYTSHRRKSLSDDELAKEFRYEFDGHMRGFKSSKENMVASIREEAIKYYKERIDEEIKNSKLVKQTLDSTLQEVASDFPNMVLKAMTGHFVSNMTNLQYMIESQQNVATAGQETNTYGNRRF